MRKEYLETLQKELPDMLLYTKDFKFEDNNTKIRLTAEHVNQIVYNAYMNYARQELAKIILKEVNKEDSFFKNILSYLTENDFEYVVTSMIRDKLEMGHYDFECIFGLLRTYVTYHEVFLPKQKEGDTNCKTE